MRPAVVNTTVSVHGREIGLSNLDKVLYPEIGFTKAEVIDYYTRIAEVMVAHTSGRCVTFRRWPDGVNAPSFFEKNCPRHRPEWLATSVGPGTRNGSVNYCRMDEPAAFAWSANLAAIELHTPMALAEDLDTPTMCVFDLDPGPGTGIAQCAAIALEIREILASADLQCWAKTSGSKGMQLYVPLNVPGGHTHEHCANFARAVGSLLERRHPDGVTITMDRSVRPGRVFIDWSQNAFHKTTVCAYSLRARDRPTVSTPVDWNEVDDGAGGRDPLVYLAADVLDRVARRGDLFAPTIELRQELPGRTTEGHQESDA